MTASMLQRLLKYPHAAVFDKSPAAQLAFRLSHPDGATWRVADETLTVTAGDARHSYALAGLTFAELQSVLQADGFLVSALPATLSGRPAIMLAEGSGDERQSNGDHLFTFTSLLWVMLSGYAVELREARDNVQQALRQMVLGQAEDIWLDLWGALYDQQRKPGELDAAFAPRIRREAFRLRVNAIAIEQAVLDATGYDITIEEPWRKIFTLDESALSGPHKFYDGDRVGYHLIQPVASTGVDWSVILPVIHRNRAAGIEVLPPYTQIGDAVQAGGTVVTSGRYPMRGRADRYEDRALLDFSAIEETSIPNRPFYHEQNILRFGGTAVPTKRWSEYPNGPWQPLKWSDTAYIASQEASREYRVYYSAVKYEGQHWPDYRTWNDIGSYTWSDYNALGSTTTSQRYAWTLDGSWLLNGSKQLGPYED